MVRHIPLACPICHDPLAAHEQTVRCPQGHAFDVAREGYINLLVLRKKPRILGDAKEMVRARRAFLQSGHYQPLSDAVNVLVAAHLQAQGAISQQPRLIVDAGCGEGYYLGRVQEHLQAQFSHEALHYCGFDIAKDAVRLAARQHPPLVCVVADVNRRILLPDDSVDVLLNIFAPRNAAEFARIVAPGGRLLVMIPTPAHLRELRTALDLLNVEPEKRARVTAQFASAFKLVDTQAVQYTMTLTRETLQPLVRMTPSYWHLSTAAQQSIDELHAFQTSVSVEILSFQKQ